MDKYVHGMDWTGSDGGGFSLFRNYRNFQYSVIKDYIGNEILEVGTGDKTFTQQILEHKLGNYNLLSIEPSSTLVALHESKNYFPDNFTFLPLDLFEMHGEYLGMFDTVLMIHVLEHIERDVEAINHIHSMLKNDGHLLIQVPAYEWLYSDHDRSIGHFRRYSRKSLSKKIDSSKFEIVKMSYQDPVGILGSLLYFKILKVKLNTQDGSKLVKNQGQFYENFIIPFEQYLEKYFSFPFGLSLTAVLKKI